MKPYPFRGPSQLLSSAITKSESFRTLEKLKVSVWGFTERGKCPAKGNELSKYGISNISPNIRIVGTN